MYRSWQCLWQPPPARRGSSPSRVLRVLGERRLDGRGTRAVTAAGTARFPSPTCCPVYQYSRHRVELVPDCRRDPRAGYHHNQDDNRDDQNVLDGSLASERVFLGDTHPPKVNCRCMHMRHSLRMGIDIACRAYVKSNRLARNVPLRQRRHGCPRHINCLPFCFFRPTATPSEDNAGGAVIEVTMIGIGWDIPIGTVEV